MSHATVRHPGVVRPLAAASSSSNGVDGNGVQSFYTYVSRRLTDRMDLKVNVGNGNLVFHSQDLHIAGTKLDLKIDRYDNSQAVDRDTDLTPGWNLSTGFDVFLSFNSDKSVDYLDPSGTDATFSPDGNGGYTDPKSLDATLTRVNGALYKVTYHKTGEVLSFDGNGFLIKDESQNGNDLDFSYNSAGQLTAIVDTQGRSTTFAYDASGRLTTITDPVGRTITYSYDSTGNLAASTDMADQTTSYAYVSGTHDISQITDPAGNVTQIGYSGSKVTSLTDPAGAVTSFKYNSDDTTTVTEARGNKTTYSHDDAVRITKATDALGHTQSKTYTPDSNIATVTDALGDTASFTYDTSNNITSATDAGGAKVSYTYDDSKHPFYPTTQKDAQGNTLSFTYNSAGDLTGTKDTTSSGTGVSTSTDYNSNGTPSSVTDGNGNKTAYGYDSQGNLIKITPPAPLGATTLAYDALSRPVKETDGKGQQTSISYDNLDHVVSATYGDGSSIGYRYDADGNITQVIDSTGTTTFTYDADNRLTTKTLPSGVTLTFTYDPVGNLVSFTDQGGTVTYGYNEVNLLTSLTEPGGAQTTFTYDAKNHRTQENYPNGVTIDMDYDKSGHETSVSAKHGSTLLAGYTYDFKSTSLRQSVKDQVTGLETDYQYDSLNRLITADVNQGSTQVGKFHYNHDHAGNITAQTVGSNQTTFTYNAADEVVSTSQGVTYGYDADGNRTSVSAGNVTLDYNAQNQTTSVNGVPMAYSGAGQTTRVQAGTTSYTDSPLGVSSASDTGGTTYYTRDVSGNLIDERTPTGTYYYLSDAQGSVVGLTDSSGNLAGNERYQYDPYGNLTASPSSPVLQANPWRYTGGQYDTGSGYYKFGTRYYDPATAGWTQQDPKNGNAANPPSLNKCAYANNDPVNMTDPTGTTSLGVIGNFGKCAASEAPAAFQLVSSGLLGIAALAGLGQGSCSTKGGAPGWVCVVAGVLGALAGIATLAWCVIYAIVATADKL